MKTATYRRCRARIALAAIFGALVSFASPSLLASNDAAQQPDATITTAEQVDCTNHGGKVRTLQCAMRPLDRVPGGRWLKWAIGALVLVGVPFLTIRHVIGFWRGLRPASRRRDDG